MKESKNRAGTVSVNERQILCDKQNEAVIEELDRTVLVHYNNSVLLQFPNGCPLTPTTGGQETKLSVRMCLSLEQVNTCPNEDYSYVTYNFFFTFF